MPAPKNPKKRDPVKYRKLVNKFRIEWVEKSKNTPVQIIDSAQNFSLWLDEKGYSIKKVGIINKLTLKLWQKKKSLSKTNGQKSI